jgi:hypothetical protein
MKAILAGFGLVFTFIGIGLFFLLVKPTMDTKRVLKKGVETTAFITGTDSAVTKGGERHYYLRLFYINTAGEKITAKTGSVYPESFIVGRKNGQEIAKYNSKTKEYDITTKQLQVMYIGSKAVVKGFVPEDVEWWTWIYPLVFGGIGVLILIAGIMGPAIKHFVERHKVIQAILGFIARTFLVLCFGGIGAGVFFGVLKPPMDARRILRNGVETTAAIISLHSNHTINDVPYYFLKLSFINSEGEEITVETNSLYSERFISDQKIAAYNKATGKYDTVTQETVRIKYIGKKAVLRSYVPDKTDNWLWVFPIVFGAIGAFFLIAMVAGIVKVAGEFIVKHIIRN